jgi:tRNA threonylcarbamoyladenosine biosynthesis protein TsaB
MCDMFTLVIEASTAAGSIALLRDDVAVQRIDVPMGVSQQDALFPAVQRLLVDQGIAPRDLGEIVCGEGPGSFTSLRIAAAVAKGLAHAVGATLFAVPSLLLAATSCDTPGRYVVHADALRGERYALRVRIEESLDVFADGPMQRVTAADLLSLIETRSELAVLGGATSALAATIMADAARLSRVGAWRAAGAVSLANWEPAYGRLAEAQVKWEALHHQPMVPARIDPSRADPYMSLDSPAA